MSRDREAGRDKTKCRIHTQNRRSQGKENTWRGSPRKQSTRERDKNKNTQVQYWEGRERWGNRRRRSKEKGGRRGSWAKETKEKHQYKWDRQREKSRWEKKVKIAIRERGVQLWEKKSKETFQAGQEQGNNKQKKFWMGKKRGETKNKNKKDKLKKTGRELSDGVGWTGMTWGKKVKKRDTYREEAGQTSVVG